MTMYEYTGVDRDTVQKLLVTIEYNKRIKGLTVDSKRVLDECLDAALDKHLNGTDSAFVVKAELKLKTANKEPSELTALHKYWLYVELLYTLDHLDNVVIGVYGETIPVKDVIAKRKRNLDKAQNLMEEVIG